ncbi:MAG TPA: hypothetical protein VL418_13390 [Devosiaceae bacterium]|nr:hypothetical protein [Devosiaceae bacterium]
MNPADAQAPYVDWAAIVAGILLASAIALVMLTFGSAIGLSFANFRGGTGVSPVWIGIAAASWLLWVEISSLMAGGYLAGRMRRRIHDATEHESDLRDGVHGLIVWAGTLLIGAVIATSGIGAAANAIGNVVGTATNMAATAAGSAAGATANRSGFDPTAYFTDALLRPAANVPAAAPGGAPAANAGQATAEVGRILANAAVNGSISDDDKTYLGQVVARTTGLPPNEATQRVDQVLANVDAAKQKAVDAAETARKTSVLAAFLTAASLLVAAVAAYWAAMAGGNHRDKQVVLDAWFRRF